MREIKFRGRPIVVDDEIIWIYGNAIIYRAEKLAYIEANGQGIVPVEWETICQYTGLKDKIGKEIYEGDIVIIDEPDGPDQVVFKSGAFYVKTLSKRAFEDELLSEVTVEVIGNIYENPYII